MTARYAEITFVVVPDGPPPEPPVPRLFCERCFSEARHNPMLRLSYSPIHVLDAGLVEVRLTGYARARGLPG
ncbi:MAG: hypothetical protein WA547_07950 [Thermoplasmata archaeon]